MANETTITLRGRLVDDPSLRFSPSGAAVANFTVASQARNFDKQRQEWVDGEAMFLSCSAWRQMAENVAESLQKGMQVIVTGRLKSRSYETKSGEKRTVFEVDVEDVGPSLQWATAKVTRASKTGGDSHGGYQQRAPQSAPQRDPWQSPGKPPAGADPWSSQPANDTPPF